MAFSERAARSMSSSRVIRLRFSSSFIPTTPKLIRPRRVILLVIPSPLLLYQNCYIITFLLKQYTIEKNFLRGLFFQLIAPRKAPDAAFSAETFMLDYV